jgi:D-proline reductase (dithiol) PrdB
MTEPQKREVDPWRFTGSFLAGVFQSRIPDAPNHDPIPWAPLNKPASECRVALLSTAGISMKEDEPFDMEMERKSPTRGDPSFRVIRSDATAADIVSKHLHIDTGYIERDLDVALPLARLRELTVEGAVGSVADSHYSIMGYQGSDSSSLVEDSAPRIAAAMKREGVDLALLAPV